MSNKAYLEFEGFNEAIARLNKLNANTKNISEKSLKKTHEIITKKAQEAITPHNETKRTEKALKKEAEIEWAGTLASVKVGFSISEGGLASIFLMYGTQSHSVSNQYGKNLGIMAEHKKDKKMYNAIFGTSTRKEVLEAQQEIFNNEIRRFSIQRIIYVTLPRCRSILSLDRQGNAY